VSETPDHPPIDTPLGGTAAEDAPLTDGALGDLVGEVLRLVVKGSQRGLGRLATSGRARLEMRQLRHDRDVMYGKLGREVPQLVEGGELEHPGLVRGVERIRELEETIASAAQREDTE